MSNFELVQAKIVSKENAKQQIKKWKQARQKVVFTNGCFDLLHYGHINYLSKAADLGDKLIIGLNADNSVKQLNKGASRPIQDEKTRAAILAA